jgi:hypothetical protein
MIAASGGLLSTVNVLFDMSSAVLKPSETITLINPLAPVVPGNPEKSKL